ncbi:hypothetical protein TrVGV298_012119 [Trichoderma virens]|nr:hypothetical protein TrVGV298_012119 [Trichoderma virens]
MDVQYLFGFPDAVKRRAQKQQSALYRRRGFGGQRPVRLRLHRCAALAAKPGFWQISANSPMPALKKQPNSAPTPQRPLPAAAQHSVWRALVDGAKARETH